MNGDSQDSDGVDIGKKNFTHFIFNCNEVSSDRKKT